VRIFFSAGEASGDAFGAALLRELQKEVQLDSIQGVGSRLLKSAGAQIVADSSTWGAIGIAQSIKMYPRVRRGANAAIRALKSGPPGVFVPIDFGRMNIPLSRVAKANGWRVIYFSPPGAWRRDKQGKDLPLVTDEVITPFSWSAEILSRMGASAHWYGHPIKQMIRETSDDEAKGGSNLERRGIAVLPGSRRSEIDYILPLFAEAIRDFPEPAEIAVAATLDLDEIRARWCRMAPNRDDVFTVGNTHGVLRRARAALVCSGSATLEAALCLCPHLVAYKVSKLVELEVRLLHRKIPHIAQPNILMNREIVPELIQQAATPDSIGSTLRRLLDDDLTREAQLSAFRELNEILGPENAIDRSVELIVEHLRDVGGA